MGELVHFKTVKGCRCVVPPDRSIECVTSLIDALAAEKGIDPFILRRRVMFDLMVEQMATGMPPDFLHQRVKEISQYF